MMFNLIVLLALATKLATAVLNSLPAATGTVESSPIEKAYGSQTTPLPAGCFVDKFSHLTRCEAETPTCTTIYNYGTVSQIQCVLKRTAAPEPTLEAREPAPLFCVTDSVGTRCMPDRRTVAPTPTGPAIEKREQELPKGCYALENGSIRCESTEPICETFVGEDGITSTACVLKRTAAPEPTTFAIEARKPGPKPLFCVTDSVGTRCMPDRRTAAPEPSH